MLLYEYQSLYTVFAVEIQKDTQKHMKVRFITFVTVCPNTSNQEVCKYKLNFIEASLLNGNE